MERSNKKKTTSKSTISVPLSPKLVKSGKKIVSTTKKLNQTDHSINKGVPVCSSVVLNKSHHKNASNLSVASDKNKSVSSVRIKKVPLISKPKRSTYKMLFKDKVDFETNKKKTKMLHTEKRAMNRCLYMRVPGSPCICGFHGNRNFFDLIEYQFGICKWELYKKMGFELMPNFIINKYVDPLNLTFHRASTSQIVLETHKIKKPPRRRRSHTQFEDKFYNIEQFNEKNKSNKPKAWRKTKLRGKKSSINLDDIKEVLEEDLKKDKTVGKEVGVQLKIIEKRMTLMDPTGEQKFSLANIMVIQ